MKIIGVTKMVIQLEEQDGQSAVLQCGTTLMTGSGVDLAGSDQLSQVKGVN